MAVFEGLSGKLQEIAKRLRGAGRVTEKDIKEVMRDIKLALLEADVNFKVVKDFISRASERAAGHEVLESLTPGQQVIKIVHDELIDMMGRTAEKLAFSPAPPSVYMMVGLQGSGKTTTTGKLANLLRRQGKNPLLAACDVYRPAAIKQLQVVGGQLNIPVFSINDDANPVNIAKSAVKHAHEKQFDVVLIDTAGRLHINEELMDELTRMKAAVKPQEILLVVDSMTGQDAVNVSQSFNEKLGIDGVILTKLDSDARGGAALSVRAVTGKPIKFAGTGEKLSDIEPFYPDRMASRILGMGDVLSLIEKAQEAFDEKKALELERKMRTLQFTMDDFLEQLHQLKNMGPLDQILGMMPGINNKILRNIEVDEKKMSRMEAIIKSMTKKERADTSILNGSRRKRIAAGSGTTIQEVNKLIKDFEETKKMFKTIEEIGRRGSKKLGGFKLPF